MAVEGLLVLSLFDTNKEMLQLVDEDSEGERVKFKHNIDLSVNADLIETWGANIGFTGSLYLTNKVKH